MKAIARNLVPIATSIISFSTSKVVFTYQPYAITVLSKKTTIYLPSTEWIERLNSSLYVVFVIFVIKFYFLWNLSLTSSEINGSAKTLAFRTKIKSIFEVFLISFIHFIIYHPIVRWNIAISFYLIESIRSGYILFFGFI